MLPIFGAKVREGWLAVIHRRARLDLAHVIHAGGRRPRIELLDSFATTGEDDALGRLAQARGLRKFRCVTLLDENDYRVNPFAAPEVPADERVQAMRWRVKDVVDFPVEGAALDVVDIPSEGNRQPMVLTVAAPRAAVSERMAEFHAARLRLDAIDIPEMALRNVAALFEEDNRGLACLLLSDEESLFVITYRGELCLSRRIDMSAATLAQEDAARQQQARERLTLELQRTLDNFDRQFGFVSVSRLIVASERDSDGLTAALRDNLYLPVLAMDLAEVADFAGLPELRQVERQAQGLLAIGAALRSAA